MKCGKWDIYTSKHDTKQEHVLAQRGPEQVL